MKMKKMYKVLFFLLVISFSVNFSFAQNKKLAQTGFKFLAANLDARSSALGTAFTGIESGSTMMFHNPAGMARQMSFADVSLGYMSWIADIQYAYAGVSFAPYDGSYGVIGLNIVNVDYGEMYGTIKADNFLGYIETGTFAPSAMAIGLSYANALSDKFSIGGNLKYARQSLGTVYQRYDASGEIQKSDMELDVFVFDFGVLYRTGFRSLNFGMVVRNFSEELKYEEDQFQLPLTFKMGLSMNVLDFYENIDPSMHSLLVSVDAIHHRDYPEQVNFGFEYLFMKLLALRAGYMYPADEQSYTLGVGLKQGFAGYNLGFDYAYTPFGVFDPVHRVSLMFSL
jgi:hypothetical protein